MFYTIAGGMAGASLASLGARSAGQIVHLTFSDFCVCIAVIVIGVIIMCKLITEMK